MKSHTSTQKFLPLPILALHQGAREKSSTYRKLHNLSYTAHPRTSSHRDSQLTLVMHCFKLTQLHCCELKTVAAFVRLITSSLLILSNLSEFSCHLDERMTPVSKSWRCLVCQGCFCGDSVWFFVVFFCLSFRFIIDKRVTAQINTEGEPTYTYLKVVTWRTRFDLSLLDIVLLFYSETRPHPRREPTMSGKERSPRHRPWSVYRANTFDLSAEMMGLALSGN